MFPIQALIHPETDHVKKKPYSLLWNMLSHCELQCTASNWASSPRLLEAWELLCHGYMDLFLIWHVWQFAQQASTKWKSKVWCLRPHACGGAKLLIRNNTASSERLQPPQMVDWPCRFANLILRAEMSIYLRRRNTELYMDELKCGPVTQHWHLNVYALYVRFYMCCQEELCCEVCVWPSHLCQNTRLKLDWNVIREKKTSNIYEKIPLVFSSQWVYFSLSSSLPLTPTDPPTHTHGLWWLAHSSHILYNVFNLNMVCGWMIADCSKCWLITPEKFTFGDQKVNSDLIFLNPTSVE